MNWRNWIYPVILIALFAIEWRHIDWTHIGIYTTMALIIWAFGIRADVIAEALRKLEGDIAAIRQDIVAHNKEILVMERARFHQQFGVFPDQWKPDIKAADSDPASEAEKSMAESETPARSERAAK